MAESLLIEEFEFIFHSIHKVSLHQKTAKIIRSKKESIENQLVCLERNTDISNNTNCKKLLDMLRSTLDQSGSYCCRCKKSLSKTEVMQCGGCRCMAYCSRACQKEDWLNGHNQACCKEYTAEYIGQFQGRIMPIPAPEDERDASKLEELERNTLMMQLKLFLDNTETILEQVKSLDILLCDCVVLFDLRECPINIKTFTYTEYANWHRIPEVKEGFGVHRSKENITCIYFSTFYTGDEPSKSLLQRLFPHKMLTNKEVE